MKPSLPSLTTLPENAFKLTQTIWYKSEKSQDKNTLQLLVGLFPSIPLFCPFFDLRVLRSNYFYSSNFSSRLFFHQQIRKHGQKLPLKMRVYMYGFAVNFFAFIFTLCLCWFFFFFQKNPKYTQKHSCPKASSWLHSSVPLLQTEGKPLGHIIV